MKYLCKICEIFMKYLCNIHEIGMKYSRKIYEHFYEVFILTDHGSGCHFDPLDISIGKLTRYIVTMAII